MTDNRNTAGDVASNISLIINEGAVTTEKIADGAVTTEKLSDDVKEELVEPKVQELREQIEAISVPKLSGELGDATDTVIDQKAMTDIVQGLHERISTTDVKAEEAVMMIKALRETSFIRCIDTNRDGCGELLLVDTPDQTVTWPVSLRQIVYIDFWQEDRPTLESEGKYWYNPNTDELFRAMRNFDGERYYLYWGNAVLCPEVLYIYNHEGYRMCSDSPGGHFLEKVIGGATASGPSDDVGDYVAVGSGKLGKGFFEFASGVKYVISGDLVLQGNYQIPEDVELAFDGGKIVVGNYSLVGDKTRIADTTDQIFDTQKNLEGTWDIPFSRPEWFGARADGVDYGSWPLRVYGSVLSGNTAVASGKPAVGVFPGEPDVFFNQTAYNTMKALDKGLVPQDNAFEVYYDTNRECFLFSPDGKTFYADWHNADEWNDYSDPQHPKARTDRVFLSNSEIDGRAFGVTFGIKTAAHIFRHSTVGDTTALERVFIDVATDGYDCSGAFQKAILMGEGNVQLQSGGVYTFRSTVRNNTYIPIDAIWPDMVIDGNGATLFFLPSNIDLFGFRIDCPPDIEAARTIRNIKCTTVKGFKTVDSTSYAHPDYTSSFCTLFSVVRGHHLVIENLKTNNMHEDFEVRWTSNLGTPGGDLTIRNWTSRNVSQPMYYGTGTLQVTVEGSDIQTRKYGQYGHHVFYLVFGSSTATRNTRLICKDTKITVPDGFMDVLVDARANYTPTYTDLNYLNKGYVCELVNCDVRGPQLGSFGCGINFILDGVRFFKTCDIVMNNKLTAARTVDAPYVIRKMMAAPGHAKLTNCTFECDNYGLIMNRSDSTWLKDTLVIDGCSVKSSFGKEAYESKTEKRFDGLNIVGVINTRGNAEIRNSSFNCPYSPLITMGKLARAHRCVRFDIQNNVAVCAGYFLYAFNVNTTVGSVISGNIVSISKDLINRGNGKVGGYSSMYMAALMAGYNEATSDLRNVAVGYNMMQTLDRDLSGVPAAKQLATAITSGIHNVNYVAYEGNVIDQKDVTALDEQV